MIERWNTRVRKHRRCIYVCTRRSSSSSSSSSSSFFSFLSFSFPFFSFLFFLFFLFYRIFFSPDEHLDRCQAVAANEWRADCSFNEPVVNGTSHGYHRTGCRQLKLLRLSPSTLRTCRDKLIVTAARPESIFRVTAPAVDLPDRSRSRD